MISYHVFALDFVSHKQSGIQPTDQYDDIFESINKMAQACINCINQSRHLESSQIIKTLVVRDLYNPNKDEDLFEFSRLLEKLIASEPVDNKYISNELNWQYSYWGQKLASILIWKCYIQKKLTNKTFVNLSDYPHDYSTFSVRSGIIMRWIYARDHFYENLENKIIIFDDNTKEYKPQEKGIVFLTELDNPLLLPNSVLGEAYEVSRYLYFALQNLRILSRKNLDLIFPTMAHIYHIQWKVLSQLVHALQLSEEYKNCSVREIAYKVQRKFIDFDNEFSKNEKIPPTHFDYEYIYLRLRGNYENAINITDPTSRSRTSVLQQKYYCHDDHNDQEFRMDWTLAQMFAPAAYILNNEVEDFHSQYIIGVSKSKNTQLKNANMSETDKETND